MINFTSKHVVNPNVGCPDKSISHRALILAAISDGKCVIRNISLCRDVLATANCLRALGATVKICGTTATVLPIGKPNTAIRLNCENSGTTARLLAGLVAGLGVECTFFGDNSLSKRPMNRILQPLMQMGAHFQTDKGYLFKNIPSKLHGTTVLAQTNSAQVKSGVLLAALFAAGKTRYVEKIPTRNHTEILLEQLGADIFCNDDGITVNKSKISAFEMEVPNDISSVAFLIALSLMDGVSNTFKNVCVNERRMGFLRVLKKSGAKIVLNNQRTVCGERIADICVTSSNLQPFVATERDVCDAIDEIPVLACLALTVKGKHTFCGVLELQYKECNRVQAIIKTAEICGQSATFDGKNLVVESNGKLTEKPSFNTFSDHRIAMSQAVLALGACNGGSLDEPNFQVSFPLFLQAVGIKPMKFALLGSNISHSYSPFLMQLLAKNANVCCSYNLEQLSADVDDQTLLKILSDYDGANITMPFKTRVAALLNSSVTSVNTVGKCICAQSTDGYGITQALKNRNIDISNAPLWIVGAGGAADACVAELKEFGCKMQIINRTQSHADALTRKHSLERYIDCPVGVLSFIPACQYELQLVLPQSVKFVFIANYDGDSALAYQAKERGLPSVSGLEMLYFQGAKSFALWTNTSIQHNCDEFLKLCRNDAR